MKKMFAILLMLVFCFSGVGVLAKSEKAVKEEKTKQQMTVEQEKTTTDADETEDENQDTEESKEETQDIEEPKDSDTEETAEEVEPGKDQEEQKDEESTAEKKPDPKEKKKPNHMDKEQKRKIVKEQLKERIQQRKEARIEAKEYIKEIKKLFKDADNETKKEILKQIAEIKKELKDYSIGVFVRGKVVDFEKYDNVKPVVKGNRTLVPIRAIIETFGADIAWENATSTITIKKDETEIMMQIDQTKARVNGKEVTLDVAPTIEKGRTLVPVRFISEAFELSIEWDEESQTVVIDE